MTIKEIIKIASGDYFMIYMTMIHNFARNMNSMTEYEQRETKKEIKRLAKLIKDGVNMHD